jgi:hypothetical protein
VEFLFVVSRALKILVFDRFAPTSSLTCVFPESRFTFVRIRFEPFNKNLEITLFCSGFDSSYSFVFSSARPESFPLFESSSHRLFAPTGSFYNRLSTKSSMFHDCLLKNSGGTVVHGLINIVLLFLLFLCTHSGPFFARRSDTIRRDRDSVGAQSASVFPIYHPLNSFFCGADAAPLPPCVGRGVCNLDELAAAGGIDADPNVALADVVFVCNSSVAANMTFTSRGPMRNVTLVSGRGGLALLTAHSPAIAAAAAPFLANYLGVAPTNDGACELEYGLTLVSLKGMSNVTVALSSNSTSTRAVRIQSYLGVAHSLLMLINGTFVANVGESVALVDYAHQAFVGMAGIGINNATSIERIAFVSTNASFVRATGGRADGGGLNISATGGSAVVAGIGVAIAVPNIGATTRINDVSVVAFDTIVSLRPIAFSDPGTSAVVGALGVAIHYPIMTPAQFTAAGGVIGKPILTAYSVHVNVTAAPLILLDSITYASLSAASCLVGGVGIAALVALQSSSVVVEAKSAIHVAAIGVWRLGASVFGAGIALSGPVMDASVGRVAAGDVRVIFASNSSLAVDAVTIVPPWTFTVNYGKVVFSAVVGVGVAMTACDVGPMPAQSALGADEALGTTAVIVVTLNASASLFLGTSVLPAQVLVGAVGVATVYATAYREYSYYPISTSTMSVVSANRQWALFAVTVSGRSQVAVLTCVSTLSVTAFVGAVGVAAYRVASTALSWMTLPAAVPTTTGAASWSILVTGASTIALTNISYGNESSILVGAVGVAALGAEGSPVGAASIGVLIDDAVQIAVSDGLARAARTRRDVLCGPRGPGHDGGRRCGHDQRDCHRRGHDRCQSSVHSGRGLWCHDCRRCAAELSCGRAARCNRGGFQYVNCRSEHSSVSLGV